MTEYKLIEGQCGTCRFASAFDYAPCPSEAEDGVHCTSDALAKSMDGRGSGTFNQDQLREYGFLDLFRLEAIAKDDYTCPQWEKK